ncbi:triple tyrosine motif-containing protein [Pseudoduganella sp. HUAS MS19]
MIAALLFAAGLAAHAAPPRLLSDYTHTAWTRLQGAPSDVVKFAQTRDGWLWIASPGGLHRFDGAQFERIDSLAGHRLQSAGTMGLLATRDGGLWIGHRFGGVTALVEGKVRAFSPAEGLPASAVLSLTEGPDGTIWAAAGGGLAQLRPGAGRFERVAAESGLPQTGARQIFFSRSGRQWVSMQGGVYWRDPGRQQFQRAWPYLDLMSIAEGPDGTMWATDGKDRGYRLQERAPASGAAPRAEVAANGIFFDRKGSMWLLKAHALERLAEGTAEGDAAQQLTRESGISGGLPQTWFEDREGNLWIGTSAGLDRLRRNRLRLLATPDELDHPGMLADSDGRILVSNMAGATYSYSSEGLRLRREVAGMTAGYRAADGALWFGTGNERWRRAPSGLLTRLPHPPQHAQHDVQAMTLDRGGRMWLSLARKGLFMAEGNSWRKDGGVAGLPQGLAPAVATDELGRIWVGYLGSRIAVIEHGRARVFGPEQGVHTGHVLALHVDGPRVWAGGEFGLGWFDSAGYHAVEGELRGISGIVRTAQGELWLHGIDGIWRLPAAQLAQLLTDPAHVPRFERFDAQDGLPGSAEQFRPLPSLVQGSDGKLWFSTANHIASIDPANIPRNTQAPAVQIRALRSGGASYLPLPSLQLPKGSKDLAIAFTALSLSMPERVRFRYRLDGVDPEWQEVQGRREAFYTNLQPGSYRFNVTAANEHGVWNQDGATMQLEILPSFTQTGWFDAMLLAAAALALLALYALRVRQLTDRMRDLRQERLAERARIARGLHDTLLQSVQGLIMFFDRQAALLPHGSEEKARIEQTLELADQLMAEGRNYIMDLRGDGDAENLAQVVRQYGTVLLNERFHLSLAQPPRPLLDPVHCEVLVIAREALFNAARHSHATRVEVLIDYGATVFLLEVRDNGHGIGAHPGLPGHFGLVGMQERAAAVGAACTIVSPPQGGTTIRLLVPAQLAYAERRTGSLLRRLWRWLPGTAGAATACAMREGGSSS